MEIGKYVRYDGHGKTYIWGKITKVYPVEMSVDGCTSYDIMSGDGTLDIAVHESLIYG